MQTYRAYIVDNSAIFKNFQEFKAEDDGEALKTAGGLVTSHAVELWEDSRLIGKIRPKRVRTPALL